MCGNTSERSEWVWATRFSDHKTSTKMLLCRLWVVWQMEAIIVNCQCICAKMLKFQQKRKKAGVESCPQPSFLFLSLRKREMKKSTQKEHIALALACKISLYGAEEDTVKIEWLHWHWLRMKLHSKTQECFVKTDFWPSVLCRTALIQHIDFCFQESRILKNSISRVGTRTQQLTWPGKKYFLPEKIFPEYYGPTVTISLGELMYTKQHFLCKNANHWRFQYLE